MGVRILVDKEEELACFYDSTAGVAFGPVFDGSVTGDPSEDAERFLSFLDLDPRTIPESDLVTRGHKWMAEDSRERVFTTYADGEVVRED